MVKNTKKTKKFPTKEEFIRGIRYASLRLKFKELVREKTLYKQKYIEYISSL